MTMITTNRTAPSATTILTGFVTSPVRFAKNAAIAFKAHRQFMRLSEHHQRDAGVSPTQAEMLSIWDFMPGTKA